MTEWIQTLASCFHRVFAPSIYFYRNPFKICEYNAIVRLAALSRQDAVLDVGCGVGKQTFCLAATAGRAVGVDPDPAVIERAEADRRRYHHSLPVEFICATLKGAGIESGTFNRVVSFSVIEHIPDWTAVASECFRVLKPGGHFIFSTDTLDTITDPSVRDRHRKTHSVCRYGSISVLRGELEAAGFRVSHAEPLCRTQLAARWFEQDIHSGGACSWLRSMLRYVLLSCAERLSPTSGSGLFLVIDAEKPVEGDPR